MLLSGLGRGHSAQLAMGQRAGGVLVMSECASLSRALLITLEGRAVSSEGRAEGSSELWLLSSIPA